MQVEERSADLRCKGGRTSHSGPPRLKRGALGLRVGTVLARAALMASSGSPALASFTSCSRCPRCP
eukprot:2195956-Rhodomonas_salina.2